MYSITIIKKLQLDIFKLESEKEPKDKDRKEEWKRRMEKKNGKEEWKRRMEKKNGKEEWK